MNTETLEKLIANAAELATNIYVSNDATTYALYIDAYVKLSRLWLDLSDEIEIEIGHESESDEDED